MSVHLYLNFLKLKKNCIPYTQVKKQNSIKTMGDLRVPLSTFIPGGKWMFPLPPSKAMRKGYFSFHQHMSLENLLYALPSSRSWEQSRE